MIVEELKTEEDNGSREEMVVGDEELKKIKQKEKKKQEKLK